jgi:hypothetical protein
MTIWDALERGLADVMSFNCGRRPLLTENDVIGMVLCRFELIA